MNFNSIAKVSYLRCKALKERNIFLIKNSLLTKYASKLLVISPKVIARKNFADFFEKYANCVVMGENVKRSVYPAENCAGKKFNKDLVFADKNAFQNGTETIEDLIHKDMIRSFEFEDYYYFHPMVSEREFAQYFNKTNMNLDILEADAVIVCIQQWRQE